MASEQDVPHVVQSPQLDAIDRAILTPLVQSALSSDTVEVTDWTCEQLHAGFGEWSVVHRFDGQAHDRDQTVQWSLILKVLDSGRGIALQGDSDRFADNTCSGAFDGDHAIYVHPDKNGTKRLIGDPICRDWRWEEESVLRAYAQKLWGSVIKFGVFLAVIPEVPDDMGLKVYLEATKNLPWGSFGTAKLTSGPILRVSDGANIALNAGTGLGTVQKGTWDGKAIVAFNHAGEIHIVEQSKTSFTAMQPPSGGDCADEIKAAYAEGKQAGINEVTSTIPAIQTAAKAEGAAEAKRTVKTRHTVEAYWD